MSTSYECQACGRKKSDYPFLNFYRFPKHRDKCQQWIELSGLTHLFKLPIEALHMKRLCADHFKPNQFFRDKPSILKPRATPTKFFNQENATNADGTDFSSGSQSKGPKPLLPKYNFTEAKVVSGAKKDGKWMNMPKISAETFYQMLPVNNAPDAVVLDRLQSHVESVKKSREPKIRRLSDLCRVCGKYSDFKMTKIFSAQGREIALEEKILRFLPIAVKQKEANMPHRVCAPCVAKLDMCFEFWESCSNADIVMRSRLSQGILTEVVESEADRAAREAEEQQKDLDQQVATVMRTWGARQLAQSIVVSPKSTEQAGAGLNQQFVVVSMDPEKLLPEAPTSLLHPTPQQPLLLPQPKTFIITPATPQQSNPIVQIAKKTHPSVLKKNLTPTKQTASTSQTKTGNSLLKKTTPKQTKNTPVVKKTTPITSNTRTLLHVPKGVTLFPPEPEILKAPISTGKKSRKSNLSEEVKNFKRSEDDQKMFKLVPIPDEIELDSSSEGESEIKKLKLDTSDSKSLLKSDSKLIQRCEICDGVTGKLVQHYFDTHSRFLCPICTDIQLHFDTEEALSRHFDQSHPTSPIKKSNSFESLDDFDDIEHYSLEDEEDSESDI